MFAGFGEDTDLGYDEGSVFEKDLAGLLEVLGIDGEKQSTGGLGVGEKDLNFFGDIC